MKDAEAVVTDTYGMFVHTDDHHHHHDDEEEEFDDHLLGLGKGRTTTPGAQEQAESGGSADGSRTVAV